MISDENKKIYENLVEITWVFDQLEAEDRLNKTFRDEFPSYEIKESFYRWAEEFEKERSSTIDHDYLTLIQEFAEEKIMEAYGCKNQEEGINKILGQPSIKEQCFQTGNVVKFVNGEKYMVLRRGEEVALKNLSNNTLAFGWDCHDVYNNNLKCINAIGGGFYDIIKVYDRDWELIWKDQERIYNQRGIFTITDEFIPVDFKEGDLTPDAYRVYKKAKGYGNFNFYKKISEPDNYYVDLLGSGKVTSVHDLCNVEHWLKSWIEDGSLLVTKKEIRRIFKKDGVEPY